MLKRDQLYSLQAAYTLDWGRTGNRISIQTGLESYDALGFAANLHVHGLRYSFRSKYNNRV